MPRVYVVVSLGGQGTVQTAMASGVPLVGIPLQPEQELNVDLAARHGMGLAVAPRHADTPRMIAAVSRTLQDPTLRARAQRVQACYADFDGAAHAAAAIRAHLADADARHAVAA